VPTHNSRRELATLPLIEIDVRSSSIVSGCQTGCRRRRSRGSTRERTTEKIADSAHQASRVIVARHLLANDLDHGSLRPIGDHFDRIDEMLALRA
jgi:hypothetical protein